MSAPGSEALHQPSDAAASAPAQIDAAAPVVTDSQGTSRWRTTCALCAARCGLTITAAQGKVITIAGDPTHPISQGRLCARGVSAAQRLHAAARLTQPLRRKSGTDRGAGQYEPISWEVALSELTLRLQVARDSNPHRVAVYSSALGSTAVTQIWARDYGTPNVGNVDGACASNATVAGRYTQGFSFGESGQVDWPRAKLIVLWGVAQDQASIEAAAGVAQARGRGARVLSINPVCSGLSAIADEWLPIRPGTDGLLALALIHVLLKNELVDVSFLVRSTNAAWLIIDEPGAPDHGLFLRDDDGRPVVIDSITKKVALPAHGIKPMLTGQFETDDGRKIRTVFETMLDRYLDARYAPAAVADQCGIAPARIERLALELAHVAFTDTVELPIAWTDCWGRHHESTVGRPVAIYALRGVAAHSNGFQTVRAIHLLQALLGAIDGPGNFRARASYPRPFDGLAHAPEELAINVEGDPLRIDKTGSWEGPLGEPGALHSVVHNALAGDPYPLDVLMVNGINLAWTAAQDLAAVQQGLRQKDELGRYRIGYFVVSDAYESEVTRFADLVLPDATFLERHDCYLSADRRPIGDADVLIDVITEPVFSPPGQARAWPDTLIELAHRLRLEHFTGAGGARRFSDYRDFIERQHGSAVAALRAQALPDNQRYYRNINQAWLDEAPRESEDERGDPIIIRLYCEPLQRIRLAAQGAYPGPQPMRAPDRARLEKYADPLPDWYGSLEAQNLPPARYRFHAVSQRAAMIAGGDGGAPWLRRLINSNELFMHPASAAELSLTDGDWVWVESSTGRMRCRMRIHHGCERETVWTWHGIARMAGSWRMRGHEAEVDRAFLLNPLIAARLPLPEQAVAYANADPLTGQAAWFDLRVNVSKAEGGESGVWPRFPLN